MEHRLRLSKNVVVVTESIDEAAKFLYRNMELKLGVKKELNIGQKYSPMPLMLNLKEGVRMMKKIYEYEQVLAFRDNPDQLAELLADVVNSYSFDNKDQEKFAEAIMRQHKTLQQSIFGMILTTISKWREAWENDNYDLRNEYTCMACNVIMEAIETKGGYAKGAPIHPPYI